MEQCPAARSSVHAKERAQLPGTITVVSWAIFSLSYLYMRVRKHSGLDSQHNPPVQREVFTSLEPQQKAETLCEVLSSTVQPPPAAFLTTLHLLALPGKDCGREPGIPLTGNRHSCQEPVCWPQTPVVSVRLNRELESNRIW